MSDEYDNGQFMHSEPIFPIGVAAKMVGVSPSTLRMYEAEGLVIPYKTATNMRLFSQQDLDWVMHIRKLIRKEKLSVQGIKRILALIPCWSIRGCEEQMKEKCEAYKSNTNPCWTIQDVHGDCQDYECRLCEVYLYAKNAFDTKKMLGEYTNF